MKHAASNVAAWATLLLSLAACGSGDVGDGSGSADATPSDATPCWPIDESTPSAEVEAEIGTGERDFEPLGDELQFVLGTQGGTFLRLHSMIRGMDPGDQDDLDAPGNPFTKFHAILQDGSIIGKECATTVGYEELEDGSFQRSSIYFLEFLPWDVGEAAFDTDITLVVEVIDSSGRYARDERTVFGSAPVAP